jgi:hypothetical protein
MASEGIAKVEIENRYIDMTYINYIYVDSIYII